MLDCMERLMAFARLLPDSDGGEELRDQVLLANDEVEELLDQYLKAMGEEFLCLPVDKDGRTWHICDEVDLEEYGHYEVVAVNTKGIYYWNDEGEVEWTQAHTKRHWEPETVERLLEGLMSRVYDGAMTLDQAKGLIPEYAEKLELRHG